MQAKIVRTLLIALLVLFSNIELPGSSVDQNRMGDEHTPMVHQRVAPSWAPIGISTSYGAENRFEDYWDESEGDSKGPGKEGFFNIFLKTGNPYVKAGVFVVLTIIFYLASWAIFRAYIMKYRSPGKTFVYSFLGFLLFVYASAFVCFSEYAMIQAYDEKELYLFQLNWMIVLVSFSIWAIFSLVLTYMMKGKA